MADERITSTGLTVGQAEELDRETALMAPILDFPWHPQQERVLRAATDIVSANGGNQSGKTQSGLGVCGRLVRREGPIYRRLRNPAGRKLLIWVAPKTLEKYQSAWEPRILDFVFRGFTHCKGKAEFDATAAEDYPVYYRQTPFPTWEWKDPEGGGTLAGKAQKQGFMAFESDKVDLVVVDEEPEDPRILSSIKARFATTNGVLVLCFTPLLGMSFTYHQYYQPTARPEYQIGDRCWQRGSAITIVEMGMADNPESVAGGGVDRMMRDPTMSEAEKSARLFGKYGYTEGLLFPMWVELGLRDEDPYWLDRLPTDRGFEAVLTADPNKRHGGLLTFFDHEGNRYYVGEHYAESLPDSKHTERYRALLALWGLRPDEVATYADPGGAGAQAILNMAEGGIFAQPVPKDPGSVRASIKRLRGAAFRDPDHRHPVTRQPGAPKVYFLRFDERTGKGLRSEWVINNTLYRESRLAWELRQYRQAEGEPWDTPVKELDDVVDPARYAELVRAAGPEAPAGQDPVAQARAGLDPLSRDEAERFAALETRAQSQFQALYSERQRRRAQEYTHPNDQH